MSSSQVVGWNFWPYVLWQPQAQNTQITQEFQHTFHRSLLHPHVYWKLWPILKIRGCLLMVYVPGLVLRIYLLLSFGLGFGVLQLPVLHRLNGGCNSLLCCHHSELPCWHQGREFVTSTTVHICNQGKCPRRLGLDCIDVATLGCMVITWKVFQACLQVKNKQCVRVPSPLSWSLMA